MDADAEPVLSSFLYGTVLAQASFDKALAFVLANRLASSQLLPTQLMELFGEVLASHPCVRLSARCDVAATRARDPACRTHADCLLYFKARGRRFHSKRAIRATEEGTDARLCTHHPCHPWPGLPRAAGAPHRARAVAARPDAARAGPAEPRV